MFSFLAWQKAPSWEIVAHWEDMREKKSMLVLIRSQLVLGSGWAQDRGKVWALHEAWSGLNESVCRSFILFVSHLTCHDHGAFVWLFEP